MLKKINITLLLLAAFLGLFYGVYLPFIQARKFIEIKKSLPSARTLQEIKVLIDNLFATNSPVGDEEMPKFLSNDIIATIFRGKQSEQVSEALISILEPYMFKNDVRHLMLAGGLYESVWRKHKNDKHYLAAVDYYKKALLIGPDVPNVLYPLFSMYKDKGDLENAKLIGEHILNLWPGDESVRKILDDFELRNAF